MVFNKNKNKITISLRQSQKYTQLMEISNRMLFIYSMWNHGSTKNKQPNIQKKIKHRIQVFYFQITNKIKDVFSGMVTPKMSLKTPEWK